MCDGHCFHKTFQRQIKLNRHFWFLSTFFILNHFQNCLDCVADIVKTVDECSEIAPDDEEAYIHCVEDALIAAADCVECICEVMEIITGIDVPDCG